jgi:predicted O-methyltransferase YrrM
VSADPGTWAAVDRFFAPLLPADPALDAALRAGAEAGLPAADVAPNQGRLLELLVRISGARRVLEIGTLAGYSTIWLARALPPGGRVISLELEPAYAAVARQNLDRAGVGDSVEIRVGPATASLTSLAAETGGSGNGDSAEPFDLVFIDADKQRNPEYLEAALALSRPGTVIVADNVVRGGAVADGSSADPSVRGVRAFFDAVAAEPRLRATAIQTVGSKGYDGFALALVG